jgi:hypothetical protein
LSTLLKPHPGVKRLQCLKGWNFPLFLKLKEEYYV